MSFTCYRCNRWPCKCPDGITLIHGDCREVLPLLRAESFVTDPPYGVNIGDIDVGRNGRGGRHGLTKGRYVSYDDTYENYLATVVPGLHLAISSTIRGASFVGPHIQELPKFSCLGGIYCPAGSGRHSWGFKTFLPILFFGKDPSLYFGARPNVIQSSESAVPNGHPCPKPIGWMKWLIDRVSLESETILDPFAGSGTTLVAAKQLGRRCIGIEIEEKYCKISANRLRQGVLDFSEVNP